MIFFRVPALGEKPPEEWRWIFEQYDRLRELERPRVLPVLRALILWLRHDAETLHRAALRLQIGAPAGEVVTLSNLGAGGVRERLAVRGFDARYLLFTEGHLDRLSAQLALTVEALRDQAWWLAVAAESVAAWIDTYHERQRELRAHARGRAPSVGLAFLVDQTLECRPSEVARRLVEARVLPEREGEHDDLHAQWLQLLKRARTALSIFDKQHIIFVQSSRINVQPLVICTYLVPGYKGPSWICFRASMALARWHGCCCN